MNLFRLCGITDRFLPVVHAYELGSKLFLGRSILVDVLLLVTVTSVASVASIALIAPVPRYVFVSAVVGLFVLAQPGAGALAFVWLIAGWGAWETCS